MIPINRGIYAFFKKFFADDFGSVEACVWNMSLISPTTPMLKPEGASQMTPLFRVVFGLVTGYRLAWVR